MTDLGSYPPPESWDDWREFDPKAWPRRVERAYTLVPTVCFNCESACGLLAYVDKETFEVRKLEGNPHHPASRGRNCAKGPATINQIHDPERILHPLRRKGPRGSGDWERVSWDHVLDTFAERMHEAFAAGRPNDVMYFVGRPGEDGFADRFLETWGCDGHNSHTNVCSSGGRTGYGLWMGTDRPSPDYASAKFTLLISAHLEAGHYFNPHAQRIVEGQQSGGKVAVIDPRLSNTASMADHWLPAWPGTEAAVLLAIAKVLLDEDLVDRDFVRRWVNWRTYLMHRAPGSRADAGQLPRRAAARVRPLHAGVRRGRERRARRHHRGCGPRDRRGRARLLLAHLARRGGGQPARLADHPGAVAAQRAHRIGRQRGRGGARTRGTSSSRRRGAGRSPTSSGTS